MMDQKPLRDVWQETHFNVAELAASAGVYEREVLGILRGEPALKMQAERVLAALSLMTKQKYSLDTVRVPLVEVDQEAVAKLAQVHMAPVLAMFGGRAVWRRQAEKIFRALSALTNQRYSLDTVMIPLIPEGPEQ